MGRRMLEHEWNVDIDISRSLMDDRIKNCTQKLGWQHATRLILERGLPFSALKIAEVGCGTGTTALTFSLLGASVTLLDYNRQVLDKSHDIYTLYDCTAEFVQADCMDVPSEKLRGKFDVVISSGLAEHFIGGDREECIRYHKLLLKEGGFAYIGVPNKLSPFYQWVKGFRKLTGSWKLEIELPFTKQELKNFAAKVGFKEAYIIGNAPLKKDLIDYSLGFGSAVKELFPSSLQERLRSRKEREMTCLTSTDDLRRYCQDIVSSIRRGFFRKHRSPLTNTLSAGLILFALN
jgi:2-polyprenyl-3-methyl-5-hydroxy-6-metoxy-1,4-benzoquinol methylase